MAVMRKVAVVVAQAGADAGALVNAAGEQCSVELFQQAPGESETQLSQRLRARLSTLSAGGAEVETAAFVAKPGFGSDDVLGAAGLVRSMVALMVAVGAGRVRILARPRDSRARVALAALTDALAEQLRGTGVRLDMELPEAPAAPARERVAVA